MSPDPEAEIPTLRRILSARDRSIAQLGASHQTLRAEIDTLTDAAQERLAVIDRLVADVESHRKVLEQQSISGAEATRTSEIDELRAEVMRLEKMMRSLNDDFAALQRFRGLQPIVRREPGLMAGLLARIGHALAQRTPYPLARLAQHEPRARYAETFPRRRSVAPPPRICIVTPSFQQGRFLERTMLSVLDQGYPNLAYGVQDGGSTDESATVIERHIGRLWHAESSNDKGQADAIQRGFAKLYPETGNVMAWLNSDDLLMPGALPFVGDYFARHPEVDVIYGHRLIIDEQDREIGRWYLPRHRADTLALFDLVPQETVFWRAEAYERIGGIDATFDFALDWDLLLRFQEAGLEIRRLPYFLGCFRVHAQQKTHAAIDTIGEPEMLRIRRRAHGREIHHTEIQKLLERECRRSAIIAALARWGVRV